VDRIVRGYVVDFVDLYVRNQHWPFFNVADSCISVGAVLLIISLVRRKPACTPSS
jgi:signal peptidase II